MRKAIPNAENDEAKAYMILIQHDIETIQEIVGKMLASAGYKCRSVTSLAETWDALSSDDTIELLLCKVAESLESGMLERVVENFPNVPVIVWGGRPESVFLEAVSKGAAGCLPVPFEKEELLAVVRRGLAPQP
jgi:DNA-binding NtrC family response regulator